MRISTSQLFRQGVDAIVEQRGKLAVTQDQLSSGRKNTRPSENPAVSATILALESRSAKVDQFQRNIDTSALRLSTEELALSSGVNALQRVRELTVAANSSALSSSERGIIAGEIRARINELFDTAASRDAQGEFLFAGFRSDSAPFARDGAGNVSYVGDQGQRKVQVGDNHFVATGDSGFAVWEAVRTGNGAFAVNANPANAGTAVIDPGSVSDSSLLTGDNYTIRFSLDASTFDVENGAGTVILTQTYTDPTTISFDGIVTEIKNDPAGGDTFEVNPSQNQSIFASLNTLVDALESQQGAPLQSALNAALENIDQNLLNLNRVRTSVGTRLQVLDSQKATNDALAAQLTTSLSTLKDTDYAEAASDLNRQLLALQAAQQSFVKIQGLSLFSLLPG
jgi:flagellar hook-associated protein 3 FlgL